MNDTVEIRISDVFHVIWRRRLMISILAVCGLVVGIVLSVFNYMRGEMKRTYAITSAIAVTSQTQDGLYTNNQRKPNSADITLAENMADSVIYVLKSDKTLNAAIQRLSLIGVSTQDIYKNLTVTKYGDTQIIEMTLYWRNAEEGVEILNAINATAPDVLSEVLQIGNVSVVNNPKAQYIIGGSVNAKLWVLMVLAGIAVGAGLSVCELLFRPKLIESEDLTAKFGLQVLGEIPEDTKYFRSERPTLNLTENTPVDERFAGIGRILEYGMQGVGTNCLCVTAATGREGTSSIAANLAYRISETDRKVLIADLNTHNPRLSSLLEGKADYFRSLNGLYYGDSKPADAIHRIARHLDMLPVTADPAHPVPLNKELTVLLKDIAKNYDCVLLDLPPLSESADILAMRDLTDRVLFVARCDTALLSEIGDSLEKLKKAGFTVAGCVANGVKAPKEKKDSHRNTIRRPARIQDALEYTEGAGIGIGNQIVQSKDLSGENVLDESLKRQFEEYRK